MRALVTVSCNSENLFLKRELDETFLSKMQQYLFILLVFFTVAFHTDAAEQGCIFDLDRYAPATAKHPPHLLTPDFEIINPILNGSSRIITLQANQVVYVGCLGAGVNSLNDTGVQLTRATCRGGDKLLLETKNKDLKYLNLGCVTSNKEIVVENATCANGLGTLIQVGYLAGVHIVPLYESCFDNVNASVYYSINRIPGKSTAARYVSTYTRPYFSQGGYFPGLDVNKAYTQEEQVKTLAKILNSQSLAESYIKKNEVYLSRGHLAPNADFIDGSSQNASFYFFNAAPQWEPFNSKNWEKLETNVRNESIVRDILLTIYTGTYGILQLKDYIGVPRPIYMAFDRDNNGLIPVPKYFWKVVHDPVANKATAVIAINNPHMAVVPEEDIFCPDVCDQVPWVNWNVTSITNGYTFCCKAADLHKVVPYAPDFDLPLFVGAAFTAGAVGCLCFAGAGSAMQSDDFHVNMYFNCMHYT